MMVIENTEIADPEPMRGRSKGELNYVIPEEMFPISGAMPGPGGRRLRIPRAGLS